MLALLIAQDIIEKVPTVKEAQVYLLSEIGKPLDDPLVATATVRPANGELTTSIEADVAAIIEQHLDNYGDVRGILARQEITLY